VKAIEVVSAIYRKYFMHLNFGPGKSEAMLAFRGAGAKEQDIALARAGNTIEFRYRPECEEPEGLLGLRRLRIVKRYKHLGSTCVITGSIDLELNYRRGQALRALSEVKPILKMGLGPRMNKFVVTIFVLSRLFYGAAAWPSLSSRNLATLRTIYMKIFRTALGQAYNGKSKLMTDEQLVQQFKIVPIEVKVAAARLKFFTKLTVHASEPLRTLLTAVAGISGTYSREVAANLETFSSFDKCSTMPPFSENPHRWGDSFRMAGMEFRELVDKWALAQPCLFVQAQPSDSPGSSGGGVVAQADPFSPFGCPDCDMRFNSKQSLGLHKRRVHQFIHPIRTMVWGSKCTECHLEFHTRPRLIQHLAYDNAGCRASFLDGEPLELPRETVDALDLADSKRARAHKAVGLPIRFADIPALPPV
jgi:hypothetical protein